jgi:hypothetical protein
MKKLLLPMASFEKPEMPVSREVHAHECKTRTEADEFCGVLPWNCQHTDVG